MTDPQVDRMSVLGRDDREAVRALRAEWDHAVPSAGGPSPYASWLEREVVRSRRQASGAVPLSAIEAAMLEVLAREEIAKHRHPPHDLIRARDKLHERAERGEWG